VPKFDSPMTLAPNTYLLKFKDSICEDFIFQWLSTKEFYSKLLSKIGSSTLQAINKDSLRSIVLSIPNNIKEQIEIAAILIDMDNEILSLENRLAKIKLIKQGMMQNLLTGKIRLV
jgi:type I restriction enzyme S subunit